MSVEDVSDSAEFNLHIRNLLYNYSKAHLTTDYLTFTEDLVSEFIGYLKPIPLTESYSLVLAVDPFQTFRELRSLSVLKPFDEVPQTTNEAVAYLKRIMGSDNGKPFTDRVASMDCYNDNVSPEPFFPALTRRSRKNTPKLGERKDHRYSAEHFRKLLKERKIHTVLVELVKEEVLSSEDILQLKCQIPPNEVQAVRTLLQTTTDILRSSKTYTNKYLDPKYLHEVPLVESNWPEEPFMPIFPRSCLPRSGTRNTKKRLLDFQDFIDIPKVVVDKVAVEDPDGDITRQNLVIVDGWETIRSSPPSTPTSEASENEDQFDQLFLASSPNTDPIFADDALSPELVLMPRSRKIGGSDGVAPHILSGHTLDSFLRPLLKATVPPANLSSDREKIESVRQPRSSPTPSSLLGQPPTVLDGVTEPNTARKLDVGEEDLDTRLESLYAGHSSRDIIMKETLDNKHQLLMDVPDLPPPNVHEPNNIFFPTKIASLLLTTGNNDTAKVQSNTVRKTGQTLHKFLKKVRGRESLGLTLSWIPFTVDKKLPSAAELLGVANIFDEKQLVGEIDQIKLGKLLESMDLADEDTTEKRWSAFDAGVHNLPDVPLGFEIVRTRQERSRLAMLEGRLNDVIQNEEYDVDEEEEDEVDVTESIDLKRQKSEDGSTTIILLDTADTERPMKRLRLESFTSLGAVPAHEYVDMRYASPPGDGSDQYQPGSPAFSTSDDKENWCPITLPNVHLEVHNYADIPSLQYGENGFDILQLDAEESFESLPFGSRQPESGSVCYDQTRDHIVDRPQKFNIINRAHSLDAPMDSLETNAQNTGQHVSSFVDSQGLELAPEIASRSLGILAFAQLRAKKITEKIISLPRSQPVVAPPTDVPADPQPPPKEIFGQCTIQLQEDIHSPLSVHRYMASLEVIQKQALVRVFRSDKCAIELVERQTLDGVDLILDPHTAVIFLSLFVLSARCDSYVESIAQQSWRYSHILIVFEAYPEHHSKHSRSGNDASSASELYAYTPPIVKALKKFKRNLDIAEACGTKCRDTKILFAFADNVHESAMLTRMYGDITEARDETQGIIWGQRNWYNWDFSEDEEERLACLNGLNHFSASIILCQISLQDFVDLSSQERVSSFARFIGVGPMTACNTDIEKRLSAIHGSE